MSSSRRYSRISIMKKEKKKKSGKMYAMQGNDYRKREIIYFQDLPLHLQNLQFQ